MTSHSNGRFTTAPCLNIAEICSRTCTLGPGRRFAIWVQGCCFNCPGCVSPEWRERKNELLLAPEVLAARVLAIPGLEGVTISGGEPMLQAQALSAFLKPIRHKSALTVICFTGFTFAELKQKKSISTETLLTDIDVLITGPYVEALNDNKGLRGSSNQEIHFLTDVYRDYAEQFAHGKRDIEVHLRNKHVLMVGVHPKNFNLRAFVESLGSQDPGGIGHVPQRESEE